MVLRTTDAQPWITRARRAGSVVVRRRQSSLAWLPAQSQRYRRLDPHPLILLRITDLSHLWPCQLLRRYSAELVADHVGPMDAAPRIALSSSTPSLDMIHAIPTVSQGLRPRPIATPLPLIGGVRGEGHYPCRVEAWCTQDSFVASPRSPGPASLACCTACLRGEGVEILTWSCCVPAWISIAPSRSPKPPYSYTARWFPRTRAIYQEIVQAAPRRGTADIAVDYLNAQYERRVLAVTMRTIMQRVDAFILPAQPIPANTR